ncbi:ANTAR domain-containing protein [Nocardia tengchongensis]|uniref:ANTAR domain-containing protein n=1 Tax=Nocardia tengchongensis TaxID=2055889 RepID=A0ABX8CHL0_9NOCA|nr:ANTAR domain-containing protein [Nocardia tengchongensis]
MAAKGVLMRVYGIDAEQAFALLRWRAQETNTNLRDLAQQLLAELGEMPTADSTVKTSFDHLLLTVHERIPTTPAIAKATDMSTPPGEGTPPHSS